MLQSFFSWKKLTLCKRLYKTNWNKLFLLVFKFQREQPNVYDVLFAYWTTGFLLLLHELAGDTVMFMTIITDMNPDQFKHLIRRRQLYESGDTLQLV